VQSTANNNWLDLGFSFTVVNSKTSMLCPAPIPDIPLVDAGGTGRMMQIFMGQHFFQCALWVNYVNGVLDFTVPSNTSQWWLWIPAIPTKWPNAKMDMRFNMNKLGSITITQAKGLDVELPIALNLTVDTSSGKQHAATIGLNPDVVVKAWIGKGAGGHPFLYINVTSIKLKFSVIDSSVGNIDLSLLQGLTDFIVPIMTKIIDDAIKGGFPIPVSKGLGLTNDEILFNNGYLAVEADFVYTSAIGSGFPRASPLIAEDDMKGDDVVRGV